MMRHLSPVTLLSALLVSVSPHVAQADAPKSGQAKVTWKKIVVDRTFRSEGVAVADVNKDGKNDIIVGDVWYEAPDWKMHVLRKERKFDPLNYSDSFACFAEDFNGDGWPDVIVLPFPGARCFWYENPQKEPGPWKEHLLATSACNETPMYVDLLGTGKRVLVMGWQPEGKEDQGQMCYFMPGKDPTQLWEKHAISEPSQPGKEIPGTRRFSHGLGAGDINGDGKLDVIVPQGWWEQPAKLDGQPWMFHPANLGPACADMYAHDVDGDGKADVLSSSAHDYGFWWYQQKPGQPSPAFLQRELFSPPGPLAVLPKEHQLSKEEVALYGAVNKVRLEQKRAPWRIDPRLSQEARAQAAYLARGVSETSPKAAYPGKVLAGRFAVENQQSLEQLAALLVPDSEQNRALAHPGFEIGLGYAKGSKDDAYYTLLVGDSGRFSLPSQTHALCFVDINGDGRKDLVTGRRWWAHGPRGDAGPNDPAYLYWFEAKRDSSGFTTFVPHRIDDDSGIGTQFTVVDLDGDGIPDVVISNKRGVYAFLQVRKQE
jgi:hypothetical protein